MVSSEVWLDATEQITDICERFTEVGERWAVEVPQKVKSGELTPEQGKEWLKHMCSMQRNAMDVQLIAGTIHNAIRYRNILRKLIPQLEARIVMLEAKKAREEKEDLEKFLKEEKDKLDQSLRRVDEEWRRKEEVEAFFERKDLVRDRDNYDEALCDISKSDITDPERTITQARVDQKKTRRRSRSLAKVVKAAATKIRRSLSSKSLKRGIERESDDNADSTRSDSHRRRLF